MTYKRIYAKEKAYDTFKTLKHKRQIDADVDMFDYLIELALKEESKNDNVNNVNANICDGVTG